jgi:hypothetical protein
MRCSERWRESNPSSVPLQFLRPAADSVFMPNVLWFFPSVIAGGVMWLLAYQLAPLGREFSLGRAMLTVFLLGVSGAVLDKALKPIIGELWILPVYFVVSMAIVKVLLDLTFLRSAVAVLVYWLVWMVAVLVIAHFGKPPAQKPKAALPAWTVASLTLPRPVIPSPL